MVTMDGPIPLGHSIPANTHHAVSVSLPTWNSNVGYEEGEDWVVSAMTNGYPRFFIHRSIEALSHDILVKYGHCGEECLLFPTTREAQLCADFVKSQAIQRDTPVLDLRILDFYIPPTLASDDKDKTKPCLSSLAVVVLAKELYSIGRSFWQHTGAGVSSRRAEACSRQLNQGTLLCRAEPNGTCPTGRRLNRGPRRYQRKSAEGDDIIQFQIKQRPILDSKDSQQFVEERFGRNMNLDLVENAKRTVRLRIAGSQDEDVESMLQVQDGQNCSNERQHVLSENDVYLFPTGMNSIFNAHQMLLSVLGNKKACCFGFPYIDTLKILQKWGPGCMFFGKGETDDLDMLEQQLLGGDRVLALFCEFPSNPLLKSPDLARIRRLADTYGFAVVVDESVGNFLNVHVLPFADILVSSLTKIFSGDCNVMAGSMVLNPQGRYHSGFIKYLDETYEDNFWAEDAIFLERNSRDFASRIERINTNALAICDLFLRNSEKVKTVNYPKHSPTRKYYDRCKCPGGGYGGLLSITFHSRDSAIVFYDNINTAKGPSLGTNFTLTSPYTILAHYMELDWAAQFGLDSDLIRISIGLEDTEHLVKIYEEALALIPEVVL